MEGSKKKAGNEKRNQAGKGTVWSILKMKIKSRSFRKGFLHSNLIKIQTIYIKLII